MTTALTSDYYYYVLGNDTAIKSFLDSRNAKPFPSVQQNCDSFISKKQFTIFLQPTNYKPIRVKNQRNILYFIRAQELLRFGVSHTFNNFHISLTKLFPSSRNIPLFIFLQDLDKLSSKESIVCKKLLPNLTELVQLFTKSRPNEFNTFTPQEQDFWKIHSFNEAFPDPSHHPKTSSIINPAAQLHLTHPKDTSTNPSPKEILKSPIILSIKFTTPMTTSFWQPLTTFLHSEYPNDPFSEQKWFFFSGQSETETIGVFYVGSICRIFFILNSSTLLQSISTLLLNLQTIINNNNTHGCNFDFFDSDSWSPGQIFNLEKLRILSFSTLYIPELDSLIQNSNITSFNLTNEQIPDRPIQVDDNSLLLLPVHHTKNFMKIPESIISFLHGVNSSPWGCFSTKENFWPLDYPKIVSSLRYCFGCDTSCFQKSEGNDSIPTSKERAPHLNELTKHILFHGSRLPFDWITHSYGSFLLKSLFNHQVHPEVMEITGNELFTRTRSFTFLGAPHIGAKVINNLPGCTLTNIGKELRFDTLIGDYLSSTRYFFNPEDMESDWPQCPNQATLPYFLQAIYINFNDSRSKAQYMVNQLFLKRVLPQLGQLDDFNIYEQWEIKPTLGVIKIVPMISSVALRRIIYLYLQWYLLKLFDFPDTNDLEKNILKYFFKYCIQKKKLMPLAPDASLKYPSIDNLFEQYLDYLGYDTASSNRATFRASFDKIKTDPNFKSMCIYRKLYLNHLPFYSPISEMIQVDLTTLPKSITKGEHDYFSPPLDHLEISKLPGTDPFHGSYKLHIDKKSDGQSQNTTNTSSSFSLHDDIPDDGPTHTMQFP